MKKINNKEIDLSSIRIRYDFEYIKNKFTEEYKNIKESEFEKLIPITSNMVTLELFYQKTGISIFYNYITETKSLFITRYGMYVEYDDGVEKIPSSAKFFEKAYKEKLECDVLVEEQVLYIGVTKDYKYVIVPKGKLDNMLKTEEESMY